MIPAPPTGAGDSVWWWPGFPASGEVALRRHLEGAADLQDAAGTRELSEGDAAGIARARERLALALDVPTLDRALGILERLDGVVGWLKVGAELFTAAGPPALAAVSRRARVFLDTKLHDIPNSVAGAVRAAVSHGVDMLTLHVSGGPAMLRAARAAAEEAADALGRARPKLIGVTVLTSLDDAALEGVGVQGPVAAQVARLVDLALETGLDGVVVSPREAAAVRRQGGERLWLVAPGVRPPGAALDDQARTASCQQAIRDGVDLVVVGRPILQAPDPAEAARRFLEAIGGALEESSQA